jgi:hypothetical protein
MAALTPASVYNESMGSNTLYIFKFTSISTDTYTNLALGPQVIGYWANLESGMLLNCSLTATTGVFKIESDTACAGQLYVVAKQC